MIFGIGTDLVKTERIKKAINTYGERFLRKVFTEKEQEYCLKFKIPDSKFANKFAAKEAVCKAFGQGIQEYGWKNIEVFNDENGRPGVILHNKARDFFNSINGKKILISISDTKEYSIAVCVIEI